MKRDYTYLHLSILSFLILAIVSISCSGQGTVDNGPKFSMSYVQDNTDDIPDPYLFTHLIYSFGEFNEDNDKVVIKYPEKLKAMSKLKDQNPDLKILISIGGYKKEGFHEMTGDKKKRTSFVKSCKQIIKEYNLDGIDFDWEFPGTERGGHTAGPDDKENYVHLMKDMRKALGKNKWISFYSNHSAAHIDFPGMLKYVDYVNVSGYNLSVPTQGQPLNHQSNLYPSKKYGEWCIDKSIKKHIRLGVPREKILLGIPFFARVKDPKRTYLSDKRFDVYDFTDQEPLWDDDAKVPYYTDVDGNLIMTFDNEKSVAIKSDYIRRMGLAGSFVWHYDSDYSGQTLSKTLYKGMGLTTSTKKLNNKE